MDDGRLAPEMVRRSSAEMRLTERPVAGCDCGPEGHRLLRKIGAEKVACDENDRTPVQVRFRMHHTGLVDVTEAADGGWRRGVWLAYLTPAGEAHLAEVLGVPGTDVAGCGKGQLDVDGRCGACGRWVPLTNEAARRRIEALGEDRRQEETRGSEFSCITHGRCRYAMVTTKKTCSMCGELLIRHLTPVT